LFCSFATCYCSFDGNLVEDWSRFPMAQHKLYQTILSSNVQVPILISGDVHMSELLQRNCRQRQQKEQSNILTNDDYSPSRMLLEVTVSGM
jgi:phosphodiesterase/alkaline phosphatase D-like protein